MSYAHIYMVLIGEQSLGVAVGAGLLHVGIYLSMTPEQAEI